MAGQINAELQKAPRSQTAKVPTSVKRAPVRAAAMTSGVPVRSQPTSLNGGPCKRQALLHLQRTIGNQATGRLLRTLNDKPSTSASQHVQRKCATCEHEDRARRQVESDEQPVQMRTASAEPALDTDRAAEAMARAGGGSPLEPGLQAQMERGFGADFSDVRVHSGGGASEASDAINARAFTHGPDIYLGPGASPTDHRLMAHELTHVVQQGHRSVAPDVRRRIGDEHDLQSPRFAGNLRLEAAFDNESYVQIGARGQHVAVLQQALVDAGHPLAKHGEDGIFGSETHGALKSYQSERGLRADGIVGQETMGDLDRLYATSPPHPHIPPELPDICSLLLLEQKVQPDENGLVSTAFLTPEQRKAADSLPSRTLPDGQPAIECQIPGVTPQADKDWYMLKPPPIYKQESYTCWAASLASWLNVKNKSTISDNGLLDIYKSPPSTCLDRRGVLLYAHDDAVFGEWWMEMVKVERAEWEKVKTMLRTHGHLVVATGTDSNVAHDMVIYGYGFDEKGEPCSGCVSLMDPNGGTYRNDTLFNLGFPLYLGIPKSERGSPAACRKKPLP